jgi:hypothetical protein
MSQLHVSVRHNRLASFATLLLIFAAFSHSAMAARRGLGCPRQWTRWPRCKISLESFPVYH